MRNTMPWYKPMDDLRSMVTELLAQMGSSREARQYLKYYADREQSRFAVVKVGGGVLRDDLDGLANALAILHRLGLRPIVLHGAGPQLDAALAAADIPIRKHNGLRITDTATLAVARPEIYRQNARLLAALEARGVKARGLQHGVFQCDYLDREQYGLVGRVERVELDGLRDAVNAGALPVLTCLGESVEGQVLNINADAATAALVGILKPAKIIFLTPTGGLLDENGELISAISLQEQYDELMAAPWVHSGMRLKLQEIKGMLDSLPGSVSVSITAAGQLSRELFTHGGAGTLIRRGEPISELRELTENQLQNLRDLVENAFGRRLQADWRRDGEFDQVLLAQSGRAAAIILPGVDNTPYLDKFIVTPQAQGEGLGNAVWQRLQKSCPKLYWRARTSNPVADWYFRRADHCHRENGWVVYLRGIHDAELRERMIGDALQRQSGWVDES